jgi:hypothetical protein
MTQQGLGLLKGHIKGVNTELFAAGDEIWVGATGGYTNIRPKGEDVLVQKLGTVVKANANGSGIINLGEVQYNLNPNNIFIGGADSLQTTANLPTVLSDSLNNYVTISGTETITGAKKFTSDLNVDAKIALNDGDDNIVIGDGAGASLVSGQALGNILVGTQAGAVIDSGDYNVANGFQALYSNTLGTGNQANGYKALFNNELGSYNIANGPEALYNNINGIGNQANGNGALYKNESGSYNVANGYLALYELSSGSNNQAYGTDAGRYYGSGSDALTIANGSLFLGSNTRALSNNSTNEIVIGTNAIGNGSNSVTIGNDGTIGTATSKTILNGNIGIGTSNPEANLDIIASITSAANYQFRIRDVGNNGFFSVTEGSSGSSVYLPNFRGFGDGIDDYGIIFTGGPNSAHDIGTAGRAAVTFEAAEYDSATNVINAVENTHLFNFTNYGVSKMFMQNNGYVGIGTTTPDEKLDVDGNIKSSGSLTLGTPLSVANGGTGSATQNFVDLSTTQIISGNKTFNSNETVITNTSSPALLKIDAPAGYTSSFQMYLSGTSYGIFGIANNSDDFIVSSTYGDFCLRARPNEKILFSSDGGSSSTLTLYQNKVGIGTTSPFALLHVSQPSANTIFRLGNNTTYDQFIYFNGANDWSLGMDESNSNAFVLSNASTIGTNDRVVVTTEGNVGIGVTPSAKLEVAGSNAGIKINATGSFAHGPSLLWNAYADIATGQYRIGNNSGTLLTLTSAGNLGIGTTTDDGYKLDVNGTGRFSNSLLTTTSASGALTAKIRNTVTSASGLTLLLKLETQ